jgi:hypothetical protein
LRVIEEYLRASSEPYERNVAHEQPYR